MLETISLDARSDTETQWTLIWERFRDCYQARMKGVEVRDLRETIPDRMIEEAIAIVFENGEAGAAWTEWMRALRDFASQLEAGEQRRYPADMPAPPEEPPRAWRRARQYYQNAARRQFRRRARLAAIRVIELLAIAREYRAQ